MAGRKAEKSDFNAPLRSLSDRLRSLQREAGQLLEAARLEPRRGGNPRDSAAASPGREAQISRMAANFLDRWDIPTRADLDEIHQRLDRIETAILSLQQGGTAAKGTEKRKATSKTRRRRPRHSD